jgi:hypothetical protein
VQIVASRSGVGFLRRGTCEDARCDLPLRRSGGTGAISMGRLSSVTRLMTNGTMAGCGATTGRSRRATPRAWR